MGKAKMEESTEVVVKANKSAGVPRPFKSRNLKRLEEIAGYFGALVKDFARATGDDEWIRVAKSANEDFAKSWDELHGALERAPDEYTATGKKTYAKKATAAFSVGDEVSIAAEYADKYPADRVGEPDTIGTVVDIQTGVVVVSFLGNVMAVCRGKHLVKAE